MKKVVTIMMIISLLFSAAVAEGSAVTRFGIDWMRTSAVSGEENAVISPASGYFALALAALGAEGETRAEILSALGLEENGLEAEIQSLFGAVTRDASAANSVWADEAFPLADEYREAVSRLLNAEAFSVPLSTEETMRAINEWVSVRTNGQIPSMLSEPLSDEAALALINTVYFKKNWESAFDSQSTRSQAFTTDAGAEVRAEYLQKTARLRYFAFEDGAQAVILPYEGGKSAYLAILPPEGVTADEYAQTLSADAVAEALNSAQSRRIALSLPKIEKEARVSVKDALKEMGVQRVFDENIAELGQMAQTDARLYISDAIQKVRLSLAERGTEAAAATMMFANATSALMPEEPLILPFDRSYLYAILDADSGAALFMGKVTDPSQFDLSAQGVALGRTFSDGVPTLFVASDEDWQQAKIGTYSLQSGGMAVESDSVHPLDDPNPTTVRVGSGGEMWLVFEEEPTAMTARFWRAGQTGYDDYEEIEIEDYALRAPSGESGTMEIIAEWKGFTDFEAAVRYSFAVKAE